MSSEVELLRCPFCGASPHRGKDKVQYDQLHGEPFQRYRIWCPHGCAQTNQVNEEQAIAAWNRRSASPSIGRVGVKALEWITDDHRSMHCADSVFGAYCAWEISGTGVWARPEAAAGTLCGATLAEAKAAAQADYEARIRSTLVYHEEPAGDTQGAGGRVKEAAETEHVERDVLSGDTQGALPAGAGTDLAAAFEHQVTQQTNAYEFKTGAKPGTWMFRCSDWIDITAILAALVSPPDNGEPIAALLDAYDAETKKLPLGHEMPTRGASTYNWRRSVVDELRKMAALQSHNEGSAGK